MSQKSKNEVENYIQKLYNYNLLTEKEVNSLCEKAIEVLKEEPNIAKVSSPVTICGDIHGQLEDLLELFSVVGEVPYANYLFMGDYVDRGYFSVETVCLLLSLKVKFPGRITLTRGNHECRTVTQIYGFYDECQRKYGNLNVWKFITEVFDFLPLAAVVENQFFCLHGGLSPTLDTLDLIEELDRIKEIPTNGGMCDLMWSDPDESTGWNFSYRGAGYTFGEDISKQFNHRNGLKMIVRAHQLAMEGVQKWHDEQCVTVFSAPNYCYKCGNLAGVLHVGEDLGTKYERFEAVKRVGDRVVENKRVPDYFL